MRYQQKSLKKSIELHPSATLYFTQSLDKASHNTMQVTSTRRAMSSSFSKAGYLMTVIGKKFKYLHFKSEEGVTLNK